MDTTTDNAGMSATDLFNGALNDYFALQQSKLAAQASAHSDPYGQYTATNGTLTNNATQATASTKVGALNVSPVLLLGAALVAAVVLVKVFK